MNSKYLAQLRGNSQYPTFRGFVTFLSLLGYVAAALIAGAGFMTGQAFSALVGIVIGIIVGILAKTGQEVSLMIADIADATIDSAANERNSREKLEQQVGLTQASPTKASAAPVRPQAFDHTGVSRDVRESIDKLTALGFDVIAQGENVWEINQPSGVKRYARSVSDLRALAERLANGESKPGA